MFFFFFPLSASVPYAFGGDDPEITQHLPPYGGDTVQLHGHWQRNVRMNYCQCWQECLSERETGGLGGNALSLRLGLRAYGHKPCKTQNRARYSSHKIFHLRKNNTRNKPTTAAGTHLLLLKLLVPVQECPRAGERGRGVLVWVTPESFARLRVKKGVKNKTHRLICLKFSSAG